MTDNTETAEVTTKTKKASVCAKAYIDNEGESSSHAGPDVNHLVFKFVSGENVEVTLDEIGDNCRDALAWHGLSQKLGDSYSGSATKDASAHELFMGLLEQLQADMWSKTREGSKGPRISMVLEAVIRSFLVSTGTEMTDAQKEAVSVQLKTKEGLASWKANSEVDDMIEVIRIERRNASKAAKTPAEGAASFDSI